tara:strand:- start:8975 stop:10120 length:1146 start_codon:yes stop_codon:yes gene_type:complete
MSKENELKATLVQKISPRYEWSGYVEPNDHGKVYGHHDKDYETWRTGKYDKERLEIENKDKAKYDKIISNLGGSEEFNEKLAQAYNTFGGSLGSKETDGYWSHHYSDLVDIAKRDGIDINNLISELRDVKSYKKYKTLDHEERSNTQPGLDRRYWVDNRNQIDVRNYEHNRWRSPSRGGKRRIHVDTKQGINNNFESTLYHADEKIKSGGGKYPEVDDKVMKMVNSFRGSGHLKDELMRAIFDGDGDKIKSILNDEFDGRRRGDYLKNEEKFYDTLINSVHFGENKKSKSSSMYSRHKNAKDKKVVRRVVDRKLFDSDRQIYHREDPTTGEKKYYTKWSINNLGGKEREISENRYWKIKRKMKKRQDRVRGSSFKKVNKDD